MSAAAEMDYYPKATSSTLHELYLKEREYAINCGYVVMGTSVNTMEYAFENAGQYYGYNNTSYTYHSESNTTKSFIINEIDNNRPVQLVTVGDAFYGNHAMMITGYRELYSLIHTSTYSYDISVFFVSVLDGHSSSERWFDIQSLSSFPHVANQYRYSYVYSAQLIVG
ncbi:MAG: C39 family peptidase [Bacilli bacterium]|nr:C39 family peptidase [Bacilli bacterium]